jgi:photosynthetic reaction center cytochrome c subunit
MKLRLKRLICVGAIVCVLGAAYTMSGTNTFAQAQTQPAPQPQMSEQAFKNIQVLKGIPVDEFMGTMGLFSAALSVCCGDCHTGAGTSNPQWEADPPRKQIARRMVLMVNNLNRTNFGGRPVVTCWTCHRGSPSPSSTPAMDLIYGEAVTFPPDIVLAAPAGSGPTADQLFDKYIQALGGAQRLASLTSYVAKGTSTLFGEVKSDPVEIYAKAPNQLATIVHQREGDMARTFDGRNAWVMVPLTVTGEYPLTASALEGGRLEAQLAFPAGIKPLFSSWRVSYPGTVEGRDVYVVQGTGAAGMIATFYFDKETGLLNRVIHYANTAVGRVPTQIDYSDYRSVGGVMMPFKWTYGWISGREEYALTDVQVNVPIDAAKFGKPVQRAQ